MIHFVVKPVRRDHSPISQLERKRRPIRITISYRRIISRHFPLPHIARHKSVTLEIPHRHAFLLQPLTRA